MTSPLSQSNLDPALLERAALETRDIEQQMRMLTKKLNEEIIALGPAFVGQTGSATQGVNGTHQASTHRLLLELDRLADVCQQTAIENGVLDDEQKRLLDGLNAQADAFNSGGTGPGSVGGQINTPLPSQSA